MLAALLTNLGNVTSTGRSAASRYWYAVPKEEFDEVVETVVEATPTAKKLRVEFNERVEDPVQAEMMLRNAATMINLSVTRQRNDEGIELIKQALQEIDDEEAIVMLFH